MPDKIRFLWIGLFVFFWLFVGTLVPVIARMVDVFPGDNLGIFIGVMQTMGFASITILAVSALIALVHYVSVQANKSS
jgi:hypothetical protein